MGKNIQIALEELTNTTTTFPSSDFWAVGSRYLRTTLSASSAASRPAANSSRYSQSLRLATDMSRSGTEMGKC